MKEKSFEENMEEMEEIVKELEGGKLNLEDSMKKFEEGMELSKKCNKILEEAEKKITKLVSTEEGVSEEDF